MSNLPTQEDILEFAKTGLGLDIVHAVKQRSVAMLETVLAQAVMSVGNLPDDYSLNIINSLIATVWVQGNPKPESVNWDGIWVVAISTENCDEGEGVLFILTEGNSLADTMKASYIEQYNRLQGDAPDERINAPYTDTKQ